MPALVAHVNPQETNKVSLDQKLFPSQRQDLTELLGRSSDDIKTELLGRSSDDIKTELLGRSSDDIRGW